MLLLDNRVWNNTPLSYTSANDPPYDQPKKSSSLLTAVLYIISPLPGRVSVQKRCGDRISVTVKVVPKLPDVHILSPTLRLCGRESCTSKPLPLFNQLKGLLLNQSVLTRKKSLPSAESMERYMRIPSTPPGMLARAGKLLKVIEAVSWSFMSMVSDSSLGMLSSP